MIPKRKKREPMGVRVSNVIRSPGHMAFVRGFQCSIADKHECIGKIHAHHVRLGSHAGMSEKPDDSRCAPLCSVAHDELHNTGAVTFETKYSVDLESVAKTLWKASSHRIKYEQSRSVGQDRK